MESLSKDNLKELILCPSCKGKKFVKGFTTAPVIRNFKGEIQCLSCNGKGYREYDEIMNDLLKLIL